MDSAVFYDGAHYFVVMKGQMAIEFFFAMALVYLSVIWLANYANAGYDSGNYLTMRQDRLIAAEVASVVNSVYATNASATMHAPCLVVLGAPVGYIMSSNGNSVIVASGNGALQASALALPQVNANLTQYNGTVGALTNVSMTCNPNAGVYGPEICISAQPAGNVNMKMGECG